MDGKLHLAAGLVVGGFTALTLMPEPGSILLFTGGCAVGSLLPDIDHPESRISRYVPVLPVLIHHYFGHRGLIHAPLLPMMVGVGLSLFRTALHPALFTLFSGVVAGYWIHLMQDFCTIGGVPLLYPLSSRKFHLGNAKSGSFWNLPATLLIAVCWVYGCILIQPWTQGII